MNGRVYDPLIGRFMSADPFIQAPDMLQSYNRYAYVMNNPLNLTDPSGFSWWTNFRDRILKPVAIAYVGYLTGGLISTWLTAGASSGSAFAIVSGCGIFSSTGVALSSLGGFVAGAGGGFVAGVLASGTLEGGLRGAFTGGVFGGIGATGAANGWGTGQFVGAHAAGGCITSVAGGGACGSGAASAAFGKFTTMQTESWGAGVAQFTAATVSGGVGSMIAGGKFENGATTAAFAYLFNNCLNLPGGCRGFAERAFRNFAGSFTDLFKFQIGAGHSSHGMFGVVGAGRDDSITVDTKGEIQPVCSTCVILGLGLGASTGPAVSPGTGTLTPDSIGFTVNFFGETTEISGVRAQAGLKFSSPLTVSNDPSIQYQLGPRFGNLVGGGAKFCVQRVGQNACYGN